MKSNRRTLAGFLTFASQLVSRVGLSSRLGNQTFEGHRKLYPVLGYPTTIDFDEMYSTYRREDIAKRLVTFPAQESWKKPPEIRDGNGDWKEADGETAFVKEWGALAKRLKIYNYMFRVDKLTGIGQYGVLFLGAKDGESDLSKPITSASDLLYLQPYMQSSITIAKYVEDVQDKRFGQVELYEIDFGKTDANTSTASSRSLSKKRVHWSRVIHVVEDPEEDEVHGTPRLEDVYNRLLDVQKSAGGAAESYWLIANRGLQVDVKDGYNLDDQAMNDLEDEMEEYVHGQRRIVRTSGVDITELGASTVDPRGVIWSLIALIAGAKGWPQRILIGSERGELASTTDQAMWAGVVNSRQEQFCEPTILRPVIDWCVKYGIISAPSSGEYVINWPSIYEESDLEKANVLKAEMQAMKAGTVKPVGEIVTEDELRGQISWAEGDWEKAAKDAYGQDFFEKKEAMADAMTDNLTGDDDDAGDAGDDDASTDAGDDKSDSGTTPEVQSADLTTHGQHDYELVAIRCPLDGCNSFYARSYPGHDGLLVCHDCERTFDPEIEIDTLSADEVSA